MLKNDWKTFYIQNPWYPPRLLREKFNLKKHDLDNWRRQNPKVNQILAPDQWKLSKDASEEKVIRIMEKAWQYFLENELEIRFHTNPDVKKIIHIKNIHTSGWGFLVDGGYLSKLPQYQSWIDKGLTRTAFSLFHFYPKTARMEILGIRPEMFMETHSAYFNNTDVVEFLEHIYLRHIYGLSFNATETELELAMKVFCARFHENSFFTGKEMRTYGLGATVSQQYKLLKEKIAQRFSERLNLYEQENINWSARRFRSLFPAKNLSVCKYCKREPIDLHHLLPRSDFPEYIYHEQNVVPLCVQVHAAITRRQLTLDEDQSYQTAIISWLRQPTQSSFDHFMTCLHDRVYKATEN